MLNSTCVDTKMSSCNKSVQTKMGSKVCLILHSLFFGVDFFCLMYNSLYIGVGDDPKVFWMSWRSYGGKLKFLTYINKVLQTLFFGLALVNDIFGSHYKPSDKGGKKSKLQSLLNTFYASIAFPVGTFVVVTFWCIYAVDRELVYPSRLDGIIPPWMNHVMHTTVLPLLLVEKFITFHEYPSKKKGLSILLGFALLYLFWILWVAYYADFWVYPILQVMEDHQRVIFIGVLMAFFVSIYILGEAINSFIWRKEIAILRQKSKSSQKSNKQNGKSAKNNAKSIKGNEKQNGKPVNSPGKAGKRQKAKTS